MLALLSAFMPTIDNNKISWPAIFNLLLLSTISSGLLMADDFIQQLFVKANHAELELNFIIVVWLFSLSLWLCAIPWLTALLLAFFAFMEITQLGHISFFGEPMSAIILRNLFEDLAEVQQTGLHSFFDHWHVLPSVLLPYGLLITLHLTLPKRIALPRCRWALLIIIIVLGSKPYRATYRNFHAFTPGPTRSSLHNSFNAFSYYTVRLAFRHDAWLDAPFQAYRISTQPTETKHIWLVIPDSVRADHLGVFGYSRDTTPHLMVLKKNGQLLVRPGIASGVATTISLSNLVNLISQPAQLGLLLHQKYNLFAMAKEGSFKTFWLSSQESKLLAYLGQRYIDASITREDYPLRFLNKNDDAILDIIDEQTWPEKSLAIINLRTAHLPYEENYSAHNQESLWDDKVIERQQRQINAYDNSVRYLDYLLSEIIERFEKLKGERYLIITGDHGQLLGEQNSWGHNALKPEVIEVPVMVIAREAPTFALNELSQKSWISHYELAEWIAARLGKKVENPNIKPNEHFVQSNLPFGDTPIQKVIIKNDKLQYEKPQPLSQWVKEQAEQNSSLIQKTTIQN